MRLWYIYLLCCRDNSLYTGITIDLERRVLCHNRGHGARYTRIRRPVKLIYYEIVKTHGQAIKREIKIKTFTRLQKLKLLEKGKGTAVG